MKLRLIKVLTVRFVMNCVPSFTEALDLKGLISFRGSEP